LGWNISTLDNLKLISYGAQMVSVLLDHYADWNSMENGRAVQLLRAGNIKFACTHTGCQFLVVPQWDEMQLSFSTNRKPTVRPQSCFTVAEVKFSHKPGCLVTGHPNDLFGR
jgi:hypothetical protein